MKFKSYSYRICTETRNIGNIPYEIYQKLNLPALRKTVLFVNERIKNVKVNITTLATSNYSNQN